ncbi:glycosyl hydrolase family 88 [Pseudopedobacter saltans DSM 12145]|uniref:Glycosyl hydrolase family 88 n=1 Tax=Pseudopedobacter saltans (strain ATCC 51119 / DSM 12145 / JCM 21818 / CCUG 39354 / LMG 10337 / NBRC 100064 / NCIMB 13643) TaxID=762903 RepID=F0SAJ8_PSESL|nr:glycoside hydrolase family 88 protein [Pseudopedobacter saltans]ADY52618.1 glycosyl hydrolase family 88 [Pseudopedobacter saltans DSM 12145]
MKFSTTLQRSLCGFFVFTVFSVNAQLNVKKEVAFAGSQTMIMLDGVNKAKLASNKKDLVAPRTLEKGELKLVPSRDWTSGFFAGELWYLYELTRDKNWLDDADNYTRPLEQEKDNGKTHDMGFKIYCSFGNAYRLTQKEYYKNVIIESAKTLSTRYNDKVKAIRSWDHNSQKWSFPVIIDNMMNLELLFEATKLTGDSTFYKIAVNHANTTLKNHFRKDYSSYHVIGYDPETGKVLQRNTHQGYSDESAWARGQAWAIYGYTMCYRYTKDQRYLDQAEHIVNYFFNHKNMPKDLIPYWDFDAPNIPNEPRDVSAATVTASALLELANYSKNKTAYYKYSQTILNNIAQKYKSKLGGNKGFILSHSTGAKPSNSEVDVPLNYADYYYLEALKRYKMYK